MQFWIFRRCMICSSDTPAKVALQQSNLNMIMDATCFPVKPLHRNRRIDTILLSARNVVYGRGSWVLFNVARYLTMLRKGTQLHSISALTANQTDRHQSTCKNPLNLFCVKLQLAALYTSSVTEYRLYGFEYWTKQKWNYKVLHCQRFLCHQIRQSLVCLHTFLLSVAYRLY